MSVVWAVVVFILAMGGLLAMEWRPRRRPTPEPEAPCEAPPCGDLFFGHACTLPANHKQDRHEHRVGRSVLTWPRERREAGA